MFLFSDPTRTRTGNQASAGEWAAAAKDCERRQKSRARASVEGDGAWEESNKDQWRVKHRKTVKICREENCTEYISWVSLNANLFGGRSM